MSKIYHYAIGLHTASPPNSNLVKAHEKKQVFIGKDFKPTILENHLMVETSAMASEVVQAISSEIKEKYGQDATFDVVYVDVTDSEKHKTRFSEDKESVERLLSSK
ncbi:hypothetical protein RYA05_00340 [Pseudomonas syringae pv. actinidiae]|nr:hypothetical protein [Pseudomonas syringae pv. actinidiae]